MGMVVDRGQLFGWPDDWLNSDQKISVADIKHFVNRYFVSPKEAERFVEPIVIENHSIVQVKSTKRIILHHIRDHSCAGSVF